MKNRRAESWVREQTGKERFPSERSHARTAPPYVVWEVKKSIGYDQNGKRKRKTLYGRTQGEALKKLEMLEQKLDGGTFSDTKLKVKDYLEQWLEERQDHLKE